MAGLDKIISQIRSESESTVSAILAEAQAQADGILEEARREAQAECTQLEKRAERDAANILERGKSAADLKRRQELLAEKQRLIGETITMAKSQFKAMDEKEYFDRLLKLAVKAAQPGEGTLLPAAKDAGRIPAGFEQALNEALGGRGAHLTVSSETRDIDGGFVLSYGGVEENCSIDALFDSAQELLQDKVQEILFS